MEKPHLNINKRCVNCDEVFIKPANFGNKKWVRRSFCSRKCSSMSQIGKKKAPHTDKWKIANSILHRGKRNSLETRKKMAISKFGEMNPNWRGGISTETQLLRNSMEYKLWRNAVFERDKWICIWCFKKGGWSKKEKRQIILNADHIKPFISYPELRFAIDNGRTLCEDCHRTTDTYGAKRIQTDQ